VLEVAAEELRRGEGDGAPLAGVVVRVAEGNPVFVGRQDGMVAERAAADVTI
jgi:hypothetical protein